MARGTYTRSTDPLPDFFDEISVEDDFPPTFSAKLTSIKRKRTPSNSSKSSNSSKASEAIKASKTSVASEALKAAETSMPSSFSVEVLETVGKIEKM
jgi:hypothetical protein